jgi:hypothetical protein
LLILAKIVQVRSIGVELCIDRIASEEGKLLTDEGEAQTGRDSADDIRLGV